MKKGLVVSLYSALGCLLALAILEVSLRACGFEYPPADDPIAIWNKAEDRDLRLGRGLHRAAAKQLWEPRPGAELPAKWTGAPERVNEAGYRGPLRPKAKPAGVLRVATLGDSSTFGYGVPYAECFSAQLEARLNEAGRPAEVLDFGVVGFTLLQGIERYQSRVREFRPDVVVAAFGSVNEHHMAQGLPDAQKIARSDASESALLVWSRRARQELRVFHLLARGIDAARGHGQEQSEAADRRAAEAQAAGAHAGAVDFETAWHGVRRVSLAEFSAGLAELERLVTADGAALVVVSMPRRPGVDVVESPILRRYSLAILEYCKGSTATLYDARGDFQKYREVEHGDPSLFFLDGDDFHPTRRGHARLAQGIFQAVLESKGAH